MKNGYSNIAIASRFINNWCGGSAPGLLLILGTGLGNFPSLLQNAKKIPYAKIPSFPRSTVPGHEGMLWRGSINKKKVLVMQGRIHYYENIPMDEVVLPVRACITAGVNTLIATNAAGGINTAYHPGDLVLIKDHINFMGTDPLCGYYDERLGPRFVDMSEVYDPTLRKKAQSSAQQLGIMLREGVYAAVSGPSFETPALIRALHTLGADHVAMSLVPEVTVARQMNARVLGLSLITNYAAGRKKQVLTHEAHLKTANKTTKKFTKLMEGIINQI